jgi:hypothetical protein
MPLTPKEGYVEFLYVAALDDVGEGENTLEDVVDGLKVPRTELVTLKDTGL